MVTACLCFSAKASLWTSTLPSRGNTTSHKWRGWVPDSQAFSPRQSCHAEDPCEVCLGLQEHLSTDQVIWDTATRPGAMRRQLGTSDLSSLFRLFSSLPGRAGWLPSACPATSGGGCDSQSCGCWSPCNLGLPCGDVICNSPWLPNFSHSVDQRCHLQFWLCSFLPVLVDCDLAGPT